MRKLLFLLLCVCCLPLTAQDLVHYINMGETLSTIASKYGITVEDLKAANPKVAENAPAGTKLIIPQIKKTIEKTSGTQRVVEEEIVTYEPYPDHPLCRWTVGLQGGVHLNSTNYSDIDDRIYEDPTSLSSTALGIFARYDFGANRQYSLRPSLVWLQRGHDLAVKDTYLREAILNYEDVAVDYHLKASYFDLRLPVMYNFLDQSSALRPYVYLAPVVGLATGGTASVDYTLYDDEVSYQIDLSSASIRSFYVAVSAGLGIRYNVKNQFEIGAEVSYEYGLTDTYGKGEKEGSAIAIYGSPGRIYKAQGTRKFAGPEFVLTAGLPLSRFAPQKQVVKRTTRVEDVTPEPKQPQAIVHERECYELREIVAMIKVGKSVEGKTICATDAIEFKYKRSDIQPSSYAYLNEMVTLLQNTSLKVDISGHTDNIGGEEYNLNLSRKRAKAVYDYLVKHGISASRLTYEGYGYSDPVADNDTEEGRMRNRRVEFLLK